MLRLLIASLAFSLSALAAPPGPIVWGNNNNALYLPTNVPSSGIACLTVDPLGVISPQTCGSGGGGGGTVTSIGWGTLPSWLVGTGAPITTSGNLGLAVPSQSPNQFLASPNGSAGALGVRAIVAADIPTLNQSTTGSAGSLSTNFTSGLPLVGNSTGVPVSGTKSGVTTEFATVSGTLVTGHGVAVGSNGDLVDTGLVPGNAAGIDESVQYKGTDSLFHGDSNFKYDYTNTTLHVPAIVLAAGADKPAGFSNTNQIEPWDRTGTSKVLVNTDGTPIAVGFCYVFNNEGNFVNSGIQCPIGGGSNPPVVITTDYSVTVSNLFILANCTSDCNINLPDVSDSSQNGFTVQMKNIGTGNASFVNVTGQLIDGHVGFGLLPDKSQINLISTGGFWYVY